MRISVYRCRSFSCRSHARPRIASRAFPLMVLLCSVMASSLCAQSQDLAHPASDQETLATLLQRIAELEEKAKKIDQLEARVKELEAASAQYVAIQPLPAAGAEAVSATVQPSGSKPSLVTTAKVAGPTPATQTPSSDQESDAMTDRGMLDRMDVSKTLLRIRGFGDITLHGDDQKGDHTSFTLGQLNLFVVSDISEKFKFLSEIVFEGGPDNIYGTQRGEKNTFGVDIERMLLQYSYNDYFHLAVGRYHTAIGYYNTEFHHGTWFQTTTDRPFLFQFEDTGGILPIHNVGASASGLVPGSGKLGLHYVVEVGNGRESRAPLDEEPVQNIQDENNHKAFNVALFARPESIRGLQTGFSFYHDLLTPLGHPKVDESIYAVHAVLVRSNFEWLNEGLVIRHSPVGSSKVYNTPGFYTQLSRQFGAFTPYFRYQYVNAPNFEPIFPDVGLRQGPSFGIRYDASESVAVKLQYDFTELRGLPSTNSLALQVGFTF
jgi:hypothetical protein